MNSAEESFNGLMVMLGIVAGIGAYATTGKCNQVYFENFDKILLKIQSIDL